MPKLLIPGMPPQALPIAIVGWLAVRNASKRKRGPGRVSGISTPSRVSTPGGMDGEAYPPNARVSRNRRVVQRR